MPRPKGSKNHSTKVILTSSSSSSRTSISSLQPSLPQSILTYSNDDLNWMKTSINKISRPRKPEFLNGIDDDVIPTSSASEINGSRVMVNPAVLRYLEQNRNPNYSSIVPNTNDLFIKDTSMTITQDHEDHLFDDLLKSFTVETDPLSLKSPAILSNEPQITVHELVELDKSIQNDLFWDFCTCSTDFLTSARLAEWILAHQQSAKLETSVTVNNSSF